MRALLLILLLFFGINSFGQKKMNGVGGELSMLSLKPNFRMWVSKTTGYEVFGGISAEFGDYKPNDFEAGFKYLYTFLNNRKTHTYFGLVGKWEWINVAADDHVKINLPVVGAMVGKEWFIKRLKLNALAFELGYQYGKKKYEVFNLAHMVLATPTFNEFPLIFNLRYSFYNRRK